MKVKIACLLCFVAYGSVSAQNPAGDSPLAILKAEYEEHHNFKDREGKPKEETKKWMLQLASGMSYFYDPREFYIDSLKNDPNGATVYWGAWKDGLDEFTRTGADVFKILEEKGLKGGSSYKCLKNFGEEKMTVWDSNMGDHCRYYVPMDDLHWEIADSTKTVMGYECQMAKADYHGRKWTAWFSMDVPVTDGPWQLYGLPGLIMEAASVDGDYSFVIKGLQKCNEPIKDPYERKNTYVGKRKKFLKQKDYNRRHRGEFVAAMTGGNVNLNNIDYKGTDDYLETDYHDDLEK